MGLTPVDYLGRMNTAYDWSKIKEGEVTLLVPSQALTQKGAS